MFGAVFRLPHIPFPLFKMRKSVNSKKGDGAIVLVAVVGVKLYPDIPIEIMKRRRWMKGLANVRRSNDEDK